MHLDYTKSSNLQHYIQSSNTLDAKKMGDLVSSEGSQRRGHEKAENPKALDRDFE